MIVHIKAFNLHKIFMETYVSTTVNKSTKKNNKWWYRTTCNTTKMSHADLAQDGTIACANLSDQARLDRFLLLPSLLWQHTRSPLSAQISNQSNLQATDPTHRPFWLLPTILFPPTSRNLNANAVTSSARILHRTFRCHIHSNGGSDFSIMHPIQAFQQWINCKNSWKTKPMLIALYPLYRVLFSSPLFC